MYSGMAWRSRSKCLSMVAPTSDEQRQANRDAHALAVGRIVLEWAEYHELLGEVYATLAGDWAQALERWHNIRSDRAQRLLLLTEVGKLPTGSKARTELEWIVAATDGTLAEGRNIGAHAPLMSYTDEDGKHFILPLAMFGNKRAQQLAGLDILKEYERFREQIA